MEKFKSDISGNEFPISEGVSGKMIRNSLLEFIQKKHPDFSENCFLSNAELTEFRHGYLAETMENEIGELTDAEKKVLNSLTKGEMISEEDTQDSTFGQRIADKVASFGGSWTFIIIFGVIILSWITLNSVLLLDKGFDPYPFILLNLVLSCLAALQAPVIMMSQNRQEEKDRERAKKDYMVNLKSELEIRSLHEKLDHLIYHQQQDILEFHEQQLKLLNEIKTNLPK